MLLLDASQEPDNGAAVRPGLQEGQPNRFCYGNKAALQLFECT